MFNKLSKRIQNSAARLVCQHLTKKNNNGACHQYDDADHWYFGSIAQVTTAAVVLALDDVC